MPVPDHIRQKGIHLACSETGPGPGRYRLKTLTGYRNHCESQTRKPAYTFRIRPEDPGLKYAIGPGPCYGLSPNITRFGKHENPKYSIYSRLPEIIEDKAPGPARYMTETVPPNREGRAPAYSLRAKGRIYPRNDNPAPNEYDIKATLGPNQVIKESCPSWTCTPYREVGNFIYGLPNTPGPAGHEIPQLDKYRDRKPLYTLRPRCFPPGDTSKKPGPLDHDAHLVTVNKPVAPKATMGIKHSPCVLTMLLPTNRVYGRSLR